MPANHTPTGFLDGPLPLAFAHRGGTEAAPENSVAAFSAAHALGFRYLETDVHLSADGVVVALHDDRLDRITDTNGVVAQMTWAEIARARIGGTEPVPRFEELLEAFPDARFNVDAKCAEVVGPLLELIEAHDALSRVCVAAFSDDRLVAVRSRGGPMLCTSAGPREVARLSACSRLPGGGPRITPPYRCLQIPTRYRAMALVTPRLLRLAHRAGVQVHVWTIDDPSEMNRLLDMGVDGIMTDRPSVLRDVLETRGQWA